MTINAFSMGAWAAGTNTAQGMNRHALVKSTGPDIDKVFSTLRLLGPRYRYAICGYPPFLKHMLDEGERMGFDWESYELHGLVGGEGMAEELRDYLLKRFRSVHSGYGATDLEVGMAAETAVSIAVRRLARGHPDLRHALFGERSRLPMVFQYNPLIHWLEVNGDGEIVTTVSRLDQISPRIRYNVHDEGGVAPWRQVRATLARFGFDLDRLGEATNGADPAGPAGSAGQELTHVRRVARWRSRSSGSSAGATPRSASWVRTCTRRMSRRRSTRTANAVAGIRSFQLAVVHDESGTPRPGIHLELDEGVAVDDDWRVEWAVKLRDRLATLSRDYRTSIEEFPAAMLPIVRTHAARHGTVRR